MGKTGRIGGDEYERYYQPIYFRTLEELVAPVAKTDSSHSSMYRLERTETYEVKTPFVEEYRTTGNARSYGECDAKHRLGERAEEVRKSPRARRNPSN